MTTSHRGSALVESAIMFPVMILIIMFSAAMTDVMTLKVKGAEAVRYALWETTVFKSPQTIAGEVQAKFKDLKSPADITSTKTDLLMYPQASDITWTAAIDTTTATTSIGGNRYTPPPGFWSGVLAGVLNFLSGAVDGVMKFEKFNMHGEATVRVSLQRAHHDGTSKLLQGGDLVGGKGQNALGTPQNMVNFTFDAPLATERPMMLIFDTWKAWPNSGAALATSPMQTYPTVEKQVSTTVKNVAFVGLTSYSWFQDVNNILGKILGSGISQAILGGQPPLILSADLMDGPNRGPITILPVGVPPESWAPHACSSASGGTQTCSTNRLGDIMNSSTSPKYMATTDSFGPNVDPSRYTVPYRINSRYWVRSGGISNLVGTSASVQTVPASIASTNDYVKSWNCRGHFFAGAQKAQISVVSQRYTGFSGTCR